MPIKRLETSATTWSLPDLKVNLKKVRLGDTCSDPSVTVLEQGYIYTNPNTVSITQIGLDGRVNNVQLNGPNKAALLKSIR